MRCSHSKLTPAQANDTGHEYDRQLISSAFFSPIYKTKLDKMDHYGVSYFVTQQEIATGPTMSFDCFLEGQLIDDGNGGNGHSKRHHQFAQDAVMGAYSALDQELISMHRQPQRPLPNQQPQFTTMTAASIAKRMRHGEPNLQRKRTLNNSGPRRTPPASYALNSQPADVADPVLITVEKSSPGQGTSSRTNADGSASLSSTHGERNVLSREATLGMRPGYIQDKNSL